jgi:hypothetical protein
VAPFEEWSNKNDLKWVAISGDVHCKGPAAWVHSPLRPLDRIESAVSDPGRLAFRCLAGLALAGMKADEDDFKIVRSILTERMSRYVQHARAGARFLPHQVTCETLPKSGMARVLGKEHRIR